jgi:hypothetical protein
MVSHDSKNFNARNLFLNKYFNLILSLILLLVLLGAYFVYIGPKFQSARQVIQENSDRQKNLYIQQQKKLNSLKAISDLYGKISPADLQKFNSVLPSSYRQEKLFGEFEEIINKGGWILDSVALTSFDDGQLSSQFSGDNLSSATFGTTNPNVGRIDVTLALRGLSNYGDVKRLLKLLENNLRLFDITNISLSGESSASLVLSTYYYKVAK